MGDYHEILMKFLFASGYYLGSHRKLSENYAMHAIIQKFMKLWLRKLLGKSKEIRMTNLTKLSDTLELLELFQELVRKFL